MLKPPSLDTLGVFWVIFSVMESTMSHHSLPPFASIAPFTVVPTKFRTSAFWMIGWLVYGWGWLDGWLGLDGWMVGWGWLNGHDFEDVWNLVLASSLVDFHRK